MSDVRPGTPGGPARPTASAPAGAVGRSPRVGRRRAAGHVRRRTAPATPPATAGWSAPSQLPGALAPARTAAGSTRSPTSSSWRCPMPGLATSDAVEAVVVDRGELTFHVAPRAPARVRASRCATSPALRFELCLGVTGVHYPRPDGPRAARRLPLAVDDAQPAGAASRSSVPDADPHLPSDRVGLPDQRLARARDVGHVRHRLRRPPGADPDPDAGRLGGHPQRKDYPLGGIPVEYKGAEIPPPDERRSYT